MDFDGSEYSDSDYNEQNDQNGDPLFNDHNRHNLIKMIAVDKLN